MDGALTCGVGKTHFVFYRSSGTHVASWGYFFSSPFIHPERAMAERRGTFPNFETYALRAISCSWCCRFFLYPHFPCWLLVWTIVCVAWIMQNSKSWNKQLRFAKRTKNKEKLLYPQVVVSSVCVWVGVWFQEYMKRDGALQLVTTIKHRQAHGWGLKKYDIFHLVVVVCCVFCSGWMGVPLFYLWVFSTHTLFLSLSLSVLQRYGRTDGVAMGDGDTRHVCRGYISILMVRYTLCVAVLSISVCAVCLSVLCWQTLGTKE